MLLHITFVVTYHIFVTCHPSLKSFQSLINHHLNTLYLDENSNEVFMPGPMVTFRSTRKPSTYLVNFRVKLYPSERVTGSCKSHGKRCAVCLNINETSTFIGLVTHEIYKINHKFDCNIIANVLFIYLLTCKQYFGQYVGQTIDDFRFR